MKKLLVFVVFVLITALSGCVTYPRPPTQQFGNETNKGVTSGDYRVVWDQPDASKGRELVSVAAPKIPKWVSTQGLLLSVTVAFVLMPDGVVSVASMTRSSGYADVDSAFMEAIRHWRFTAAQDAGSNTGLVLYLIKAQSSSSGPVRAPQDVQAVSLLALVRTGTPQDVQAAIGNGSDVSARDKHGWTPLMIAAAESQNPEVIKTLIAAGADENARNMSGETALIVAA